MRYLFRHQSQRGFTLLELIVVLVILGIAVSIGTVSIMRAQKKSILKDEARRVQGSLRYARDTALLDRTPVTFHADQDSGTFWLERGEKVLGKRRRIPNELEIIGQSIVFMPKGNSTGGVVTIKRSKEDRGYVIEVDTVTGTAKIRRL